jgi:hypothetical protein
MLSISYQGWAQCRLATDPDPYDEPRGVSGYMQAYVGEPDLDRIIRFQDPPVLRSHTQNIGVRVSEVLLQGVPLPSHPLLNAKVDLLDDPVFEGRNGVVSEDGLEPVFPFHLRFATNDHWFSRAIVPADPDQPYREFNASDASADPGRIARATGILSIAPIWQDRLNKLKLDLQLANSNDKPGIEERIAFLERCLASTDGPGRFFVFYMAWDYQLTSKIEESPDGLNALMQGFSATRKAWRTTFWFGGWDADAAAYWVSGVLEIGDDKEISPNLIGLRPERMSDI